MNENQAIKVKKTKTTMYVAKVSLFFEAVLTIYKMAAGVIGRSGAMISDAIHSASDVLSTIVVMIGVKMAGKVADEKHPYGHERMESVAALILAIGLGFTGVAIGYQGLGLVISGQYRTIDTPKTIALVAAVVSILVKEAMFWYARYYGKKLRSSALVADAWHHRSDALSSIGSLLGIFGAQRGVLILEPIACVVISCFIIKVAFTIFKDSINEMMDCSVDKELEEEIRKLATNQEGVEGVCTLKTRKFGMKIYVDIDIYVNNQLTLDKADQIAELVHDVIEEKFALIKHVVVRVVPDCRI